jgi:PAS domain S-box-containing protein
MVRAFLPESRKDVLACGLLACVYFAAARLSIGADLVHPFLSALWPPSGLALAALLAFGSKHACGVFAGSLAYLVSLHMPWPEAAAIAALNSAEAYFAAAALERVGINSHSFYHPRDFSIFAGVTAAAAGAASLLAAVVLHHLAPHEWTFAKIWLTRLMAHWSAALVIAPALLTWYHHPRLDLGRRRAAECLALAAASVAVAVLLFSGASSVARQNVPLSFMLIPLLMWPAVRMGVRETATTLCFIAAFAVFGTLRRHGPFAALPPDDAVSVTQAFLATIALSSITLTSAVWRAKDDRRTAAAARDQLRMLTDAMPALISFVDREGRYRFVNGTYEAWHGKPREKIIGTTIRQAYGEDYERVRAPVEAALEGKLSEWTGHLRFPDGRERWVNAACVPRRDPAGAIEGIVMVVFDIGKLKRAEEALRQAERRLASVNRELEKRVEQRTARLRQVNDELESFCYSVAHDLRSPLRAMSGFSEAVLHDYQGCLEAKGSDYLKRIFDASRRMARMIDEMLDLSRVTRREARDERVDLSALANAILDELKRAHPGRRVETRVEPGLVDHGDPGLMETALRHLLDNAWKFTSQRAPAVIGFGALPREPSPAYFVRDNGVGFDREQAQQLLTSFEPMHSERFPGRGIGLATVQRVVQRHGGRLWAEGEPGKGATFYFTLHDSVS